MRIDLDHLPVDGIAVTETLGTADLVSGDEERFEPLGGELSVCVRTEGNLIRMTGRLVARLQSECDRCLKPTIVSVESEFDLRYTLDANGARPDLDEVEVDLSAPDVEALEGPEFSTARLAREQLELNAPIRIVCSESCAGLCPVCRADRNTVLCGCEEDTTDPRWDGLKQFQS